MWYDVFMRRQTGIEKERQSKQSFNTIKRADIILIAGCLLSAVLTGIFLLMYRTEGGRVNVFRDGVEIAAFTFENTGSRNPETKYYLIQDMETEPVIDIYDTYPELPEDEAFNLFSITGGDVKMEAADCSDQICVHHNVISAVGESIICLPHRIVITVAGDSDLSLEVDDRDSENGNDDGLDGVVE